MFKVKNCCRRKKKLFYIYLNQTIHDYLQHEKIKLNKKKIITSLSIILWCLIHTNYSDKV